MLGTGKWKFVKWTKKNFYAKTTENKLKLKTFFSFPYISLFKVVVDNMVLPRVNLAMFKRISER